MNTKNLIPAREALYKLDGIVTFGQKLNSFRLSEEKTQVEMAKILGISKQELCNIEKNRKMVSVERAKHFAKKLKMPPKLFVRYVLQDQLNSAGIKGRVEINDLAG